MLILNFLVLVATTVSARVIPGVLSHLSSSPQPHLPPVETCAFTTNPNSPASTSTSTSQIPPTAWHLITHILTTHPIIRHHLTSSSASIKDNILQTLDLGQLSNDASLEGVILGLVFTTRRDVTSNQGQQQPLGRADGHREVEKGRRVLECLDEAIRKVGERGQMEGTLEFERGRLNFLVYRVD